MFGPKTNELRAELGVQSLRVNELEDVPAVTQAEDTLVYIAHACDRVGVDAPGVFRDALGRYWSDIGLVRPACKLGDGDRQTISEILDKGANR